MKRPYEDEQNFYSWAEMQRPPVKGTFTEWEALAIGGATFVSISATVWLLVSLWRCCR